MEDFEVKEGDETSKCRFYSLLSTVSLLVIVYPASYMYTHQASILDRAGL